MTSTVLKKSPRSTEWPLQSTRAAANKYGFKKIAPNYGVAASVHTGGVRYGAGLVIKITADRHGPESFATWLGRLRAAALHCRASGRPHWYLASRDVPW